MKAAVINNIGDDFVIEDIDIADPLGKEVLVDVKASGLCHTDLHCSHIDFGIPLPGVFGHEVAGVVSAIGPDVNEFRIGDHVVASMIRFCGYCDACRAGRTYQCKHPEVTLRTPDQPPRLSINGKPITDVFGTAGFAEQILIHEHQLALVPDELPFPQACVLGCGTITGAGAVINTAAVRPGDTVAVIGLGGVGLNVISGAKLAGATRIIAVDVIPGKFELAKRFGATDVIDSSRVDPVEEVKKLTSGGVDHSFEVVGLAMTSEQTLRMTRVGGGAYFIGVHKPESQISITIMSELIDAQRRVQGVMLGSSNIKHDIPMYAELYLQGKLNLDDLISRQINLADINEAYKELQHGNIARSVITSF